MHNQPARFFPALALLVAFLWAPIHRALGSEFDHRGTPRPPTAQVWGALKWTATELAAFKGRLETAADSDTNHFINVAYDRYISRDDIRKFAPQ